jgi:hypothetical protein
MTSSLRLRGLLAVAVLALAPSFVDAQFAPTPNPQEYLDFLNAGSAVASTGLSSRVYVGPYQGRFEYGGGAVSNDFALYCVDYLHYASNSDGLVNVYGVDGSLGNVLTTRQDNAGTYLRAAYLASMFETYEGAADQRFQWSALHAAIWRTTGGVDTSTGDVSARADEFFAMAQNNLPGDFTGEGWYVLSSVELAAAGYGNGNYDGTGQEFLVRTPTQSVPEPGTLLLLATGLLLMAFAGRKELAGRV